MSNSGDGASQVVEHAGGHDELKTPAILLGQTFKATNKYFEIYCFVDRSGRTTDDRNSLPSGRARVRWIKPWTCEARELVKSVTAWCCHQRTMVE
jgi:hypothetical protein